MSTPSGYHVFEYHTSDTTTTTTYSVASFFRNLGVVMMGGEDETFYDVVDHHYEVSAIQANEIWSHAHLQLVVKNQDGSMHRSKIGYKTHIGPVVRMVHGKSFAIHMEKGEPPFWKRQCELGEDDDDGSKENGKGRKKEREEAKTFVTVVQDQQV